MATGFRQIKNETSRRLEKLPRNLRHAIVPEVLAEAGDEAHAQAVALLSGPRVVKGGPGNKRSVDPGQYPVNVVVGFLRRSQKLIKPGRQGLTLTQLALVNTAAYSAVIHDGEDGNDERPWMEDALTTVRLDTIMNEKMDEFA